MANWLHDFTTKQARPTTSRVDRLTATQDGKTSGAYMVVTQDSFGASSGYRRVPVLYFYYTDDVAQGEPIPWDRLTRRIRYSGSRIAPMLCRIKQGIMAGMKCERLT